MDYLSQAYAIFYQFADAFAFLTLSGLGLAIIFGMMGVINLAHGEFIMCGAYVTVISARAGLALPLAMLAGTLSAGLVGFLLERFIISRLYERLSDSIVATWGISILTTQAVLILAGPSIEGIKTPMGSFELGGLSFSLYRAVLPLIALGLLAGLYWLFMRTRFGVHSRATIEDARMAKSLGIDVRDIYSRTFVLGAALAGLTGALYAPTMTAVPTMGVAFMVQSFVTVVVSGADVMLGLAPAASILAFIQSALTGYYGQLIGQIGLLVTVIIVIRTLPTGVSGYFLRRSGRKQG
ncbi:MAG: branched-chain amino acid ABC transporter permease [Deltaproteobacteria bacterium]|nr:branched-chain amino acid ABC transporter permease [Deltaproteobacteria bacterium]